MRTLLFKALLERPLTERPPAASDDAAEELARALDGSARRKLGRSLSIRARITS